MSTTLKSKKSPKGPKLTKSDERLKALEDICYRTLAETSGPVDFDQLLSSLAKALHVDAATLAVLPDTDEQLRVVAAFGVVVDPVQFLSFGSGSGLPAWVAGNGAPIHLADRTTLRNFDPSKDFGSYLAVPLRLGEKPVGVLSLAARPANKFDKNDLLHISQVEQLLSFTVYCLQLRQLILDIRKQKLPVPKPVASRSEVDLRWHEAHEKIGSLYHHLNDALAVLVGNAQCLLVEQTVMNQKSVSRVRRIEETSMRLTELGRELLALRKLITTIGEEH